MRKILIPILLLLASFPASAAAAPPAQGSPSEVIALINDYRASNGLPAYQQNSILSQIAQGQADWIASQGAPSDIHEGPGGSRPRDRAYAAGYGGGQQIFISEIAKYGLNEGPADAVAWWKTSQIHNDTMLASTYVETGCGVATDGNSRYYYVCAMGYIVGGDYTASSSSGATAQPAAPVMIPVTMADPRPDGSVVHIIRQGQTLWTLAAVYKVDLSQILELNGYVAAADGSINVVIFPGDEIMVKPAGSMPTVAPTADPNATATPSPTERPSPTSEPTQQLIGAAASTPTVANTQPAPVAELSPEAEARAANTTVYLVVGVALLCIVGVFVASFFVQRPRKLDPPDNDPFAPID